MKKLLLSLGSVAAIAAPIAAVVSCGDKGSEANAIHGVSVAKSKTGDVVVTYKGEKYFLEQGAKSLKVMVTPASTGQDAVFGKITEKDGKVITKDTPKANLVIDGKADATNIQAVGAATPNTSYSFLWSTEGIKRYAETVRELETFVGHTATDKVTSEKEAITFVNEIVKGLDLVVDSLSFVAKTSSDPAHVEDLHLGKESSLDARNKLVEELGKLTVGVTGVTGGATPAFSADIPDAPLANKTLADLKTLLKGDANLGSGIVTLTAGTWPTMPTTTGIGDITISAAVKASTKELTLSVKVGNTVVKAAKAIVVSLAS